MPGQSPQPPTGYWPSPSLLRVIALIALSAFIGMAFSHLRSETAYGLTADGSFAFGDDFINFWSAPRLVLLGRVGEIYDFAKFHEFEMGVLGGPISLYHYSYPPVMFMLSLPIAFLPYLPGLAVWFFGGVAIFGATVRAAWPVASPDWRDIALYAAAAPAVFLNAMTGQNGTWLAGVLGGGLMLMSRWPILAGAMFGLLVVKPQMAFLLPFALLAGRRWRTLFATAASAAFLLAASVLVFGMERWAEYSRQVEALRPRVLEDGTDFWYLFTSVFVSVRHLPASISSAYVAQAIVAVMALLAIIYAWRGGGPQPAKNAALVMGIFFATPYIQVYDLAVAMLVPLWLMQTGLTRRMILVGSVPLVLAPLAVPLVAYGLDAEIGPLLLLPGLMVAVHASVALDVPQRRQAAQHA